jgi:hypothetical protein
MTVLECALGFELKYLSYYYYYEFINILKAYKLKLNTNEYGYLALSSYCQILNESFNESHKSLPVSQEKNVRPRFQCSSFARFLSTLSVFFFNLSVYLFKEREPYNPV